MHLSTLESRNGKVRHRSGLRHKRRGPNKPCGLYAPRLCPDIQSPQVRQPAGLRDERGGIYQQDRNSGSDRTYGVQLHQVRDEALR